MAPETLFQKPMQWMQKLSLRSRVTLQYMIPLLIGLILMALIAGRHIYNTEIDRTSQQLQSQTNETVTQLDNVITPIVRPVRQIANNLELKQLLTTSNQLTAPTAENSGELIQQFDSDLNNATESFFTQILNIPPHINRFHVVNAAGQEILRIERWGDSTPTAQTMGLENIADQDLFSQVSLLLQGEYYTAPVSFDADTRSPVLQIAVPLSAQNTFIGTVIADVQVTELFGPFIVSPAENAASANTTEVILTNQQGQYLIDSRDPGNYQDEGYTGHLYGFNDPEGNNLETDDPALLPGLTADLTGELINNQLVTSVTFAPFEDNYTHTQWTLFLLSDQSNIYSNISSFIAVFVAIALLLGIASGSLVWINSKRLTQTVDSITNTVQDISSGNYESRIDTAPPIAEAQTLIAAVNNMTDHLTTNIESLETRFTERTRDLEVASEIAAVAVGITDIDILFSRITTLIRERFNYYHVQVFLADETTNQAILTASTGEAGRAMLAANWALPIDSKSLVGQVVATGKTLIVADTEEQSVHRPNKYLPNTRAEMAAPMKASQKIIGALDIQSTEPNTFTEANIHIFEVLANQLAIAANNVHLLEETRQQIRRVEELNRDLTRQTWDEFLTTQQNDFQAYTMPPQKDAPQPGLSTPIEVRGAVIGTLNAAYPNGEKFADDEIAIIKAVAERVSLTVENRRLVTETQASLAETERLYQTSQGITSDTDPTSIVQILYDNFSLPNRAITLNLLMGERDAQGLPRYTHKIMCGMPGTDNTVQDAIIERRLTAEQFAALQTDKQILQTHAAVQAAYADNLGGRSEILDRIQAMATYPIRIEDDYLGTLTITHFTPYTFNEREIAIFEALTGQIGTVLRSQQLFTAIETERQTLQSILDTMPTAVLVLDASTCQVTLANEQAADLLGEHVNLMQLAAENRLLRTDSGKAYNTDEIPALQALQTNQQVFSEDLTILQENGDNINVMNNAAPIVDANGQVSAVVTVFQDITELRDLQSALQDTLRETTAMYEVSKDIFAAQNLQEIAEVAITHTIMDIVPDTVHVFLAPPDDAPTQQITTIATYPQDIGLTNPYPSTFLNQQKEIQVQDVMTDERLTPDERQTLQDHNITGMFSKPLRVAGDIVGWLVLGYNHPYAITMEQQRILDTLSDQFAVALQNTKLKQQTENALSQTLLLYHASRDITRANTINDILHTFVSFSLPPEANQAAIISLGSPTDEQTLQIKAAWHRDPTNQRNVLGIRNCLQMVIPAEALRVDQPYIINDVPTFMAATDDPTFPTDRHLPQSIALIPMVVAERMLGMVLITYDQTYKHNEQILRTYQSLVDQVASAVDNRQLLEQTQTSLAETERLYYASQAIRNADSTVSVMNTLQSLVSTYNPKQMHIFLLNEDTIVRAYYWDDEHGADTVIQPLNKLPVIRQQHIEQPEVNRDAIFIENAAETEISDPQMKHLLTNQQAQAGISIPLQLRGNTMGRLILAFEHPTVFAKAERDYLIAICDQTSIVLDNWQLLQQTQQSLVEISEANERLRELDKIKSQFLANMSHELRTPLNSIIGFSRVILKGIDGPLTDMQEQDLSTIHSSGQYLLNLINDILDQSKIEADKMALHIDWFDITTVMEIARSMSVGLLKDKPVRLNIEMEPNLPQAWGDEIRTRQVLINLLSNAAKFTNEGSITINAFTIERADGLYTQVSVADTGIGIPANKMDSVFVAFEQVDGSLTRTTGGTGLGLPISKSLIEMMGGELWVESTVNIGSTFSFVIPAYPKQVIDEDDEEIAAKADVPSEPQTPLEEQNQPPRRIVMVIDDEVGMHHLYRRYLNKAGYTVEATANTDEALHLVTIIKPDMVILDVHTPDKNGWQMLKQLKEHDETYHIPVVVCSIDTNSERGYQLGAAGYVIKPFLEDDLVNTIQTVEAEQIKPRVLIIDDKPEAIRLISEWLATEERYEIMAATSGEEGLAIIANHPPDVVLLDLNMPDLDGFDVLDRLRAKPETAALPVIIITGENDLEAQAHERLQHTDIYSKNAQNASLLRSGIQGILGVDNGETSA